MRFLIIAALALSACSQEEQDRAREDYLNNCRYEKTETRDWPTYGPLLTTFYVCHHDYRPCYVFVSTDRSLVASDCSTTGGIQ